MSYQYDEYLTQHKSNVKKGYDWIRENLPYLIGDSIEFGGTVDYEHQIGFAHDASKSETDEYGAYDAYFYGGNRSYAVVQAFNKAWLFHIHRNPHHWQHWVLMHDEPDEPEECIAMPHNYIIEMICDWWAFSWQKGDLTEIFKWWDDHKDYILLHKKSRDSVERILSDIKQRLEDLRNAGV